MGKRLKRKLIGRKQFEGRIDITDPCYDRDVWCRMSADIKPGLYDCRIWRYEETVEFDGKTFNDECVGTIGIYLNGEIPPQGAMKVIGEIGVDAGMAGFFMDKPDYTDEQWRNLCESLGTKNAWILPEGFFSSSGYGDGGYPVYAYEEDGEIVALEIRFI